MNNKALSVVTQIMLMAIVISVILLFLGIGALVLIHACIVGRAFRRGFGNGTIVEGDGTGSLTSMSRNDLEKLPCFDFKAKEKGSSPVDCAVCLENFKMGEKCRLLPICKHSFHAQCVDSWLLKTPICPICRTSADSRKASLLLGEESSRFSDSFVEISEDHSENSHVGDTGNELREGQATGSSHLSDARNESSHFSESVIELSEDHSENSHVGDTGNEFREGQETGSSHLSDARDESRENQIASVGNQLSSNPTPLSNLASQSAV
ncbi:hypothetical protein L1049_001945 [Liquidambar formosana]|uniref:RING-type domain-containing protein n=1 Tax=Liquidambar formosana TaxID=63359 RepID=A0AAP0NI93_LIQFO